MTLGRLRFMYDSGRIRDDLDWFKMFHESENLLELMDFVCECEM